MNPRIWMITGATSIIAEKFAHLAAQAGHKLLLIARDQKQLTVIAEDIRLRHQVDCEVFVADFAQDCQPLIHDLNHKQEEIDLFIAHSLMINNEQLNNSTITDLINVNVLSTTQLIHAYWHRKQNKHRLLFLSSVAACRGRSKNSLYGASKAAVEIYLQGLQQAATSNQEIIIARLGFIDTKWTVGEEGVFYASTPSACAKACWHALESHKRQFYHPFFWRFIMGIIRHLPFFIYKKMSRV